MSLVLRTLQTVNWGHLPSGVIALDRGITALVGPNGSGKSSALNALQMTLLARSAGGRTASAYLHRSAAGEADAAHVLVVVAGVEAVAGGAELATLVLRVTRRGRRFLLIPEPVWLGVDGSHVSEDLAALLVDYPASRWLGPEAWMEQVLAPLGIGPTFVRLLEIPQGEVHRVVQSRRGGDLVAELVEMMGYGDQLSALRDEYGRLEDLQAERAQVRRRLLGEQQALLRLERDARIAEELRQLAIEQRALTARLAAAVHGQRARASDQLTVTEERLAVATRRLEQARAERDDAQRAALDQHPLPPDPLPHAPATPPNDELSRLAESCGAAVVGDRLTLKPEVEPSLAASLGIRWHTLVVDRRDHFEDLARRVDELNAGCPVALVETSAPPARPGSLRALARPTDSRVDAYLHRLGLDREFQPGRCGVLLDDEYLPHHRADRPVVSDPQLPSEPAPPLPVARLQALASAEERVADARLDHSRAAEQARHAAQQLQMLDTRAHEFGEADEASDEDPAALEVELAGLRRAEQRLGDPEAAERALRAWQVAQARVQEAERLLGEHDTTIERALSALNESERVWRAELERILGRLAERFASLTEAAQMPGRMVVERDGDGVVGLDVLVAEAPGRPLRSLWRDTALSGGWRAKTALLVLLSAMTGSDDGAGPRLVLLDEPAANLDEERVAEIGEVLRRLAREEGLQCVLALPTRRATERLGWADCQIGFLAPAPGETHAPPPLLIVGQRPSEPPTQRSADDA